MTQTCDRRFDEELLSGFVDVVLTQADLQRVGVHLESCESCRDLVSQITSMRAATRETEFGVPGDEQWQETPRTTMSRTLRRFGWLLTLIWIVVSIGFGSYELAVSDEPTWEKILLFSGAIGILMLLFSALLDRLAELPNDRYRRVKK